MAAEAHKHDKAAVACNHVVRRKRPAMLVARDGDGVWQFMCGKDDHAKAKQAKRVCTTCSFESYAPGLTPEEVPPGHIAERKTKTTWAVRALSDDETDQIEA